MIGLPYLFFGHPYRSVVPLGQVLQSPSIAASVSKHSRYFIVLYQEIAQTFAPWAFWRF